MLKIERAVGDKEYILCRGNWVDLKVLVNEQNHIKGYEFLHEKRSNGHIVAVLPVKHDDSGERLLLREEMTPAWDTTQQHLSALTGGVDPGDSIIETAMKELHEEAGLMIRDPERWLSLGQCFGTKSTDTVYHLFAVNAQDVPQGPPTGDGSFHEAVAGYEWVTPVQIRQCVDPIALAMYARFHHYEEFGHV